MFEQDFKIFAEEAKERLENRMGKDVEVNLVTLKKVNYTTLSLGFLEPGEDITPVTDLQPYYLDFKSGKINKVKAIDILIRDVLKNHKEGVDTVLPNIDNPIQFFGDYKNVKDKIIYQLVNTKLCQEMLNNVPHFEILDLSVIFRCILSKEASIIVTNKMLKMWNVSKDNLYENAKEVTLNSREHKFESMLNILHRAGAPYNDIPDLMYVLTNNVKEYGAGCILYNGLLRQIADELDDDFYIIPSSIHDVIITPARFITEKFEIDGMISEINETQLREDEVLSDHCYFYSREKDKIEY